jgi:hypothetical protein
VFRCTPLKDYCNDSKGSVEGCSGLRFGRQWSGGGWPPIQHATASNSGFYPLCSSLRAGGPAKFPGFLTGSSPVGHRLCPGQGEGYATQRFRGPAQPVVDGWLPQLTASSTPSVQPWLLLISPQENGLYRWWLNASLRSSLPASQPRRYTVPLYVNKTEFLRSLQVSSEREVVLLLTDRTGRVLWRATGPVTDAKLAALTNFLKSALH